MSEQKETKFVNDLSMNVAGITRALLEVVGKADLSLKGAEVTTYNHIIQQAGQVMVGLEDGLLVVDRVETPDTPKADVVDITEAMEKRDAEEVEESTDS